MDPCPVTLPFFAPTLAHLVDGHDLDAEVVVDALHAHDVVVRLHQTHAAGHRHGLLQQRVAARGGGRQHGHQAPGEQALPSVGPAGAEAFWKQLQASQCKASGGGEPCG